MTNKKNIAIILSGGSGKRFKDNYPKQFIKLFGKTIIEYCVENFEKSNYIDEILIVSNPDYTTPLKKKLNFKKIIDIVNGGKTRGESSYIGINYLKNKYKKNINVLIQDAVRPNTNQNIISNVIENLKNYNAVSVVVPVTDTVYITNNNILKSIPDRSCLYLAQTPQAFDLELIFEAYQKVKINERFTFTDDCSIFKEIYPNQHVFLVNGDFDNLKITFNRDLEIFKQLILKKNN